jgi:ketosteroid isomerase-like protein
LTLPSSELDAVLSLEERRIAAMKASDADALDAMLADQLVYTHSRARVDDKRSYLASVAGRAMTYLEITRENVQAARHGDTVVISARVRMQVDSKEGVRVLDNQSLSVWSKADGEWKYLAWQATPIAPARGS